MRKTWINRSRLLPEGAHPGQSLVQFLLVMPILLMIILWLLRFFVAIDYEQKVVNNLWFGLRSSTYGMFTQTLDSDGVSQEIQSMFPDGTEIEYNTTSSSSTDIQGEADGFGSTIGNTSAASASDTLITFSVLNPIDVSIIRSAGLSASYPNYFPVIPWFEGDPTSNTQSTPSGYQTGAAGYMWTSWTNIAKNPDKTEYTGKYGYTNIKNKGDIPTGKSGQYQGAMGNALDKAKQTLQKLQNAMATQYSTLLLLKGMETEQKIDYGILPVFLDLDLPSTQEKAVQDLVTFNKAMQNYAAAKITKAQAEQAQQSFMANLPSKVNRSDAQTQSEKYLQSASAVQKQQSIIDQLKGIQGGLGN